MPRLFVGNFDFEHELANGLSAGTATPTSPAAALRVTEAFSSVWVALAESADVVLSSQDIGRADFADLEELGATLPRFVQDLAQIERGPTWELVPWGWTRRLIELARHHGWSQAAPPWEVVQDVNARPFRASLEHEWQMGLPGTTIVQTLEDLAEVLARPEQTQAAGWVLKACFGMSARERLLGRGGVLTPSAANWVRHRLNQSGPIVFEPWVERIAEAGIQIEIPPPDPRASASPFLVGVTPLLCDRSGVYRGNRCGCDATEQSRWEPAVEIALRVASRVQQRGYFGPLGIDAMWYRDATGTPRLRALQDLNVRYTMGRLALGFRRYLQPGESATWLHFPHRDAGDQTDHSPKEAFGHELPAEVRLIETSPAWRPNRPLTHGSALLIAPSAELLERGESQFLEAIQR
jgi:hypothetical protein